MTVEVAIPISEAFRRAHEEAEVLSGLGAYRMHWLWKGVGQVSKLGAGEVIEVGAYRGGSALLIRRAMEYYGVRSRLVVCDTFAGIVKAKAGLDIWRDGEMVGGSREEVARLLPGAEVLEGVFPDQTGKALEGRTFRLAHIDVDTYRSARDAWDWIWPRVVLGGIVVFDDCEIRDTPGITQLIEELEPLAGAVWVRNHMGQATCIRIA